MIFSDRVKKNSFTFYKSKVKTLYLIICVHIFEVITCENDYKFGILFYMNIDVHLKSA